MSAWPSWFDIREGEAKPLAILFALYFFRGASVLYVDTAANTFFLDTFDVEMLPYIYIATAVVSVILGLSYGRVERAITPTRLLITIMVGLTLTLSTLWSLILSSDSRWVVAALMVWKDVHYILIDMVCWGAAGMIFNVRQGKRLFGIMSTGAISATILGGFTTPLLVQASSSQTVVLMGGITTAGALVTLILLSRLYGERFIPDADEASDSQRPFSALWGDSYLRLFFTITVVSIITTYCIDYIFFEEVERHYRDPANLASFFGVFFAVLGIANLLTTSLASGPLLTRYGLAVGLLAAPVVVGAGTLSFSLTHLLGMAVITFWIIIGTRLLNELLITAFGAPAFRILYQPLPHRERLRVQGLREMIIIPVATGVAGLLLLGVDSLSESSHTGLLAGLCLLLLGYRAVIAFRLRREYTATLARALSKRRLSGETITLDDASSRRVIEKGLRGDVPAEIIYAINMLTHARDVGIYQRLCELLQHDHPDVRARTYEQFAAFEDARALPLLEQRLERETDPTALSALLQSLIRMDPLRHQSRLEKALSHPDPVILHGAVSGLLRHARSAPAEARLNALIQDPDPAVRLDAVKILGETADPAYGTLLRPLLTDQDTRVARAALLAASKIRCAELIPDIVQKLPHLTQRGAAMQALVDYGDGIIAHLEDILDQHHISRQQRSYLIRVLGRIGTRPATRSLSRRIDHDDIYIRSQVLSRLASNRFRASAQESALIRDWIHREINSAAWGVAARVDLDRQTDWTLLHEALDSEIRDSTDRVLLLVSFLTTPQAILDARNYFQNPSIGKRAQAVEIIDNLLDRELRKIITPFLEDIPMRTRLARLQDSFAQEPLAPEARLKAIITRATSESSVWTKACALYTVGQQNLHTLRQTIDASTRDENPIIHETAIWCLREFDATTNPAKG